jgi:hypothetical protein
MPRQTRHAEHYTDVPYVLATDTKLAVMAVWWSWQMLAASAASVAGCASGASSGQMPPGEKHFPDAIYLVPLQLI